MALLSHACASLKIAPCAVGVCLRNLTLPLWGQWTTAERAALRAVGRSSRGVHGAVAGPPCHCEHQLISYH